MMKYENKMGIRFVAFLIDIIILRILASILINLGLGVEYNIFGVVVKELTYWQDLLLYLVYFVGFAVFMKGSTLGKMILGLKVLQTNYEELTDTKLIIREVVKALLMPISLVSFIVAAFSAENKSIHDLLLDSVVVKELNYVQKPRVSNDDIGQGNSPDRLHDFNEPDDDYYYDDPADKEYVDPLDDDPKNSDDKY